MRDDDLLEVGETLSVVTWKEFKARNKDWDFEFDATLAFLSSLSMIGKTSDEIEKNEEKFKKIWELVGEKICKEKEMEFVDFDWSERVGEQMRKLKQSRMHYVLVLDRSTSMNEDGKWRNLVESVMKFLERLKRESVAHVLSVLLFSDEVRVMLEGKNVKELQLQAEAFGRAGGGTSFSKAVDCLFSLVERSRSRDKDLKVSVYFMSDGDADWDFTIAKKRLGEFRESFDRDVARESFWDKEMATVRERRRFWVVGFGSKFKKLKELMEIMDGDYKEAKTGEELANSLLSMVESFN
jgi:uncharacterized protein YegL